MQMADAEASAFNLYFSPCWSSSGVRDLQTEADDAQPIFIGDATYKQKIIA